MSSTNPVLRDSIFVESDNIDSTVETMTIHGVVFKTLLLICFTLITAGWTWIKFVQSGGNPSSISGLMMAGLIGGLVLGLVTSFKPAWASATAIFYALFEGLFIGGLSVLFEARFPGIAIQATGLTFGTLIAMLLAYQSGLVRVTEGFKMKISAAIGGILIVYALSAILNLFGAQVPFIYQNGIAGIIFSLFVVGIAALSFAVDFDFIEQGQARRAPKYLEWYGAFALMVTLIWLYIECIRLLSKLRSR